MEESEDSNLIIGTTVWILVVKGKSIVINENTPESQMRQFSTVNGTPFTTTF
jgi:hypothetical protein